MGKQYLLPLLSFFSNAAWCFIDAFASIGLFVIIVPFITIVPRGIIVPFAGIPG